MLVLLLGEMGIDAAEGGAGEIGSTPPDEDDGDVLLLLRNWAI